MNIKSFIAITTLTTLGCLAFVSTVQAKGYLAERILPSSKPRLYVDFGLGHAFDSYFPSAKNTAISSPSGGEIDFAISRKNRTLTNNVSLEGGFVWEHPYQVNSPYFPFISLGLHYQYNNFDQKKTLMQFAFIVSQGNTELAEVDGQTNYTFLQNNLLANLKMDLYRWSRIMPYVNLGLGASWNQSKKQSPFSVKSNSVIENFSSSKARNTSFSYQVGGGLDFLATDTFWVSLGYVYNNFGNVQIAKLDNPDLSPELNHEQAFNFRNVAAHTIQLTGRYVFG